DYNLWRKQTGQSVTPYSGADGNGDGLVNQADYDVWRSHFGQTLPGAGSGAMLATTSDATDPNASAGAALMADYLALMNRSSASSSSPSYNVLQAGATNGQSQSIV